MGLKDFLPKGSSKEFLTRRDNDISRTADYVKGNAESASHQASEAIKRSEMIGEMIVGREVTDAQVDRHLRAMDAHCKAAIALEDALR